MGVLGNRKLCSNNVILTNSVIITNRCKLSTLNFQAESSIVCHRALFRFYSHRMTKAIDNVAAQEEVRKALESALEGEWQMIIAEEVGTPTYVIKLFFNRVAAGWAARQVIKAGDVALSVTSTLILSSLLLTTNGSPA